MPNANDLEKLYPVEKKVTLKRIPGHEFTVRKISLDFDAWIKQEFESGEEASRLIDSGDVRAIMKVFYKLLSVEDKQFLKSIKVESDMDENGKMIEYHNQVEKLLVLATTDDVKDIFMAFVHARGISLPEGFEDEGKKKARKKKK